MKTKFLGVAIIALLSLSCISFLALDSDESSAAVGDDLSGSYGTATNINLAPGYSWTYTPSYPADLAANVTTSLKVNDANIATLNNGTVKVIIPSDAQIGTKYNLVLMASMTAPVAQTAYQYVTFTVISGMTVPSGQIIDDIVKGTAVTFSAQATSSMGTVTWAVKAGTTLPAGLSLASDGNITGTPTTAGSHTVSLTASCMGQTADLVVTFTVYNAIVGGSAESVATTVNQTISSTAITQTGSDLGVTWAITSGNLPAGFTLDAATGVVSGQSASPISSTTVTITGTSANGPTQTVTKDITITVISQLSFTSVPSTGVIAYAL